VAESDRSGHGVIAFLRRDRRAVSYAIVKRRGPAWLRAVRERESAQADAAREQAGLAHEQAEQPGQLLTTCHIQSPSASCVVTFTRAVDWSLNVATHSKLEPTFSGGSFGHETVTASPVFALSPLAIWD
jgi:hypothetical protein